LQVPAEQVPAAVAVVAAVVVPEAREAAVVVLGVAVG